MKIEQERESLSNQAHWVEEHFSFDIGQLHKGFIWSNWLIINSTLHSLIRSIIPYLSYL
jgi:hypothetical protein